VDLEDLLKKVKAGTLSVEEAKKMMKDSFFEKVSCAYVDHNRKLRQGFPEVVFCQGKTDEQIVEIMERLIDKNPNVLATRATEQNYLAVKRELPEVEYNSPARAIYTWKDKEDKGRGTIVVATGGTADIPVAEEAGLTAEIFGNQVERLYDVGVAGIHRLLMNAEKLKDASVVICVAGMEGALASVVGGMVSCPVIAVPTSVGYGANFQGLSALLSMLNSCSAGVSVVNIDNGFGAGYTASLINKKYD
jgi:NCAIR mutase (PurE)-related protein